MHSYIMYKAFMNQLYWETFLNIILKTNLIPSIYCCLHLTVFAYPLVILFYFYKIKFCI